MSASCAGCGAAVPLVVQPGGAIVVGTHHCAHQHHQPQQPGGTAAAFAAAASAPPLVAGGASSPPAAAWPTSWPWWAHAAATPPPPFHPPPFGVWPTPASIAAWSSPPLLAAHVNVGSTPPPNQAAPPPPLEPPARPPMPPAPARASALEAQIADLKRQLRMLASPIAAVGDNTRAPSHAPMRQSSSTFRPSARAATPTADHFDAGDCGDDIGIDIDDHNDHSRSVKWLLLDRGALHVSAPHSDSGAKFENDLTTRIADFVELACSARRSDAERVAAQFALDVEQQKMRVVDDDALLHVHDIERLFLLDDSAFRDALTTQLPFFNAHAPTGMRTQSTSSDSSRRQYVGSARAELHDFSVALQFVPIASNNTRSRAGRARQLAVLDVAPSAIVWILLAAALLEPLLQAPLSSSTRPADFAIAVDFITTDLVINFVRARLGDANARGVGNDVFHAAGLKVRGGAAAANSNTAKNNIYPAALASIRDFLRHSLNHSNDFVDRHFAVRLFTALHNAQSAATRVSSSAKRADKARRAIERAAILAESGTRLAVLKDVARIVNFVTQRASAESSAARDAALSAATYDERQRAVDAWRRAALFVFYGGSLPCARPASLEHVRVAIESNDDEFDASERVLTCSAASGGATLSAPASASGQKRHALPTIAVDERGAVTRVGDTDSAVGLVSLAPQERRAITDAAVCAPVAAGRLPPLHAIGSLTSAAVALPFTGTASDGASCASFAAACDNVSHLVPSVFNTDGLERLLRPDVMRRLEATLARAALFARIVSVHEFVGYCALALHTPTTLAKEYDRIFLLTKGFDDFAGLWSQVVVLYDDVARAGRDGRTQLRGTAEFRAVVLGLVAVQRIRLFAQLIGGSIDVDSDNGCTVCPVCFIDIPPDELATESHRCLMGWLDLARRLAVTAAAESKLVSRSKLRQKIDVQSVRDAPTNDDSASSTASTRRRRRTRVESEADDTAVAKRASRASAVADERARTGARALVLDFAVAVGAAAADAAADGDCAIAALHQWLVLTRHATLAPPSTVAELRRVLADVVSSAAESDEARNDDFRTPSDERIVLLLRQTGLDITNDDCTAIATDRVAVSPVLAIAATIAVVAALDSTCTELSGIAVSLDGGGAQLESVRFSNGELQLVLGGGTPEHVANDVRHVVQHGGIVLVTPHSYGHTWWLAPLHPIELT